MRKWKLISFVALSSCGFLLLAHFCHLKTKGFRLPEVLSDIPNDPKWDFAPLSFSEKQNLDLLLSQTFTYYGCGDQCYVFLGDDEKTILKLFKHNYASPLQPLKKISWLKIPLKRLFPKISFSERYLPPLFYSSKIAYEDLKEETGLFFVHLNKTKDEFPLVRLKDAIGVVHTLDVNATEFLLQKRAFLLLPVLEEKIEEKDTKEVKRMIRSIFQVIAQRCDKGIRNTDHEIKRNFGFIQDKPVELDTGSFIYDPIVTTSEGKSTELQVHTAKLKRWLERYHPELYSYYNSQLKYWSSLSKKPSFNEQDLEKDQ